jgi:hypothetical protein
MDKGVKVPWIGGSKYHETPNSYFLDTKNENHAKAKNMCSSKA